MNCPHCGKAIRNKQSDLEARFDRFWSAYPRRQGKGAAKRVWDKIKPGENLMELILASIERGKGSVEWKDTQFIPLPATWLNQERWEDEYTPLSGGKVTRVCSEWTQAVKGEMGWSHPDTIEVTHAVTKEKAKKCKWCGVVMR